jgi:hypothetical protein
MKRLILTLSIILATCVGVTHGQAVFKKYGFNKKPLTLSKGKYNEFFTNDEVVQIGTVKFNTRTNKVIELLEEDTTKINYLSDRSSIWYSVDPLAEKYPNYSPYVYCMNSPVKYTDPDGRGPELALVGAAALLEYGLIATGVISIGTILYKNADGIIQIREDVKAKLTWMAIVAISSQLAQYKNFKSSLDAFSNKSKNKESKTTQNNQATASTATPNMPQNDNDNDNDKKENKQNTEKKSNNEKTQWGWRGTKTWKELVNRVNKGGTIKDLSGKVPTKQEAIDLIKESGGKINRIEGPHNEPNPHDFDHINYTTSNGAKGTIKIK